MGQTLTNGIYLPDEGERNSYSGLEANWRTLDALILTINGKAAPNIANTWTAAQTFTAGIAGDLTGNVTGTASKAIADEDGTNIKSGYVNVNGDQNVNGRKTFKGNTFFTSGAYHRNNNYEIGNTPASNVVIPIYFVDKNNATTGYVRNVVLSTGKTLTELYARNKFTSGALSPTGTDITSSLQVEVNPDGSKTLYFDGSIRNDLTPFLTRNNSLGTSTNKWKTLNGVNPGALGMPGSSYVEIDTTNWDLTGASSQSYTPAVHGWLYISIQNIAGNYLSIVGGRGAVSMDGTGVQSGLRAMLPVIANESISITIKTGSIFAARFYPMLGNV